MQGVQSAARGPSVAPWLFLYGQAEQLGDADEDVFFFPLIRANLLLTIKIEHFYYNTRYLSFNNQTSSFLFSFVVNRTTFLN